MSFSDAAEAAILDLLYENANIATLGDATGVRGSTVAGSLYIALHTADPGETGTQSTNECSYTGYARKAVARGAGAFTRSGTSPTQISNTATQTFAACTGGSSTATHFSVGVASAGAGLILHKGALSSSLAISNNVTPSFGAGALVATLD